MAIDIGFDFRNTEPYVTDVLPNTFVLPTDVYPTTRLGINFGWDTAVSGQNSDSGIDARLAGVHYSAATHSFGIGIPNGTTCKIEVAIGDALGGGSGNTTLEMVPLILFIGPHAAPGADKWYDGSDVLRTSVSDWVNNQQRSASFASVTDIQSVRMTTDGVWILAHLRVIQIVASAPYILVKN